MFDKKMIEDNLKPILATVPADRKGALVVYGNREGVFSSLAFKVGDEWQIGLDAELKLDNKHKLDLDWFAGVKKTW